MSERLRVGVVGCGVMGGFHVRNYLNLDCAKLVAVADPSPAPVENAANVPYS